jgi:hypothetical protein
MVYEGKGYRLISRLSLLPYVAVSSLRNALKQHTSITVNEIKHYNFNALLSGNELLAFVLFSLKGKECELHFIWGRQKIHFFKDYGVTPAQYLIEELVRKGTRVFKFVELYDDGLKLHKRLKTKRVSGLDNLTLKKLFNFSLQDIYTKETVSPQTLALIKSRKRIGRKPKAVRSFPSFSFKGTARKPLRMKL